MPTLIFFFSLSADHRDLHSFPTRRSSDLAPINPGAAAASARPAGRTPRRRHGSASDGASVPCNRARRSEEHTSELQSHSDLVCRLLLEKKKTIESTSH